MTAWDFFKGNLGSFISEALQWFKQGFIFKGCTCTLNKAWANEISVSLSRTPQAQGYAAVNCILNNELTFKAVIIVCKRKTLACMYLLRLYAWIQHKFTLNIIPCVGTKVAKLQRDWLESSKLETFARYRSLRRNIFSEYCYCCLVEMRIIRNLPFPALVMIPIWL